MTKFLNSIIILLLLSFIHVNSSNAELYKFIDEDGILHICSKDKYNAYKAQLRKQKPRYIPVTPSYIQKAIDQISTEHRLDPHLIKAMIQVESNFERYAVSHKGAQGLMQLMPSIQKLYGVKDPFDVHQNVEGGIKYFKYLLRRYKNDIKLALAAYNSGEGAVSKHNGIPPYKETQGFVRKVLTNYQNYAGVTTPKGNIRRVTTKDGVIKITNKK